MARINASHPAGTYVVYEITINDTGKRLIGSTGDFDYRWYMYLHDAFEVQKSYGIHPEIRRVGPLGVTIRFLHVVGDRATAEDLELREIANGVNRGEMLHNGIGTVKKGYPPHGIDNPYILDQPAPRGSYVPKPIRVRAKRKCA